MAMNPALPQPAPTLSESFDAILAGLCQAMADQCGVDRFIAPICMILWVRILHVSKRFEALFVRWREGRLRAPRSPASYPRPKWTAAASEPKPALPRAFAWLLRLVPQASVYGAQLQQLLANPEMAALLADAPQAGRLLRPLCRTLGVKPIPQLLRPKKPKPGTPAPEATSPEKPPREPPAPETTAKKARPETAKNADPGASSTHADDPRWARPVSLWSQPPRPRN